MSTKPNLALARWADLAGSFVTDAPAGLRDTGFLDATPFEADIVNAELKQLYLWDKWLDDGDCQFHDLSATGALQATGQTTLGAKLTVSAGGFDLSGGLSVLSGGVSVATGQAVALNGNTTLTVGTGAVTFGGIVNANAGIAVPTGQAVTLSGTATLSVGGNATVGGTLGVTGALTVGGLLQHEQIWQHSIAFALPDAGASLSLGSAGSVAPRLALQASTGDNVLGLAIPVGTITKWSVRISKGSATGTITAKLYESVGADGVSPSQIGSTQSNSANNPGAITLGQTGLSFAMTAGHEYFIVVNGGGTGGDMVTGYYAAVTAT